MTEGPAPIDRAEVQAMLTDEAQQRAGEVRCGVAGHPYRVLSDDAGVPYKLVCLCGAHEYHVPSSETLRRYAALSQILSDLDRCEHGRHRGDVCVGCPDGVSPGNGFMPAPGQRVGTDYAARPYFMPSGDRNDASSSTGDPAGWRRSAVVFAEEPAGIPVVQWWKNGDHPGDRVGQVECDPATTADYVRQEGAVVRFFRHPRYPGDEVHGACGRTWHDHGWIDRRGGVTVCPGEWVAVSL